MFKAIGRFFYLVFTWPYRAATGSLASGVGCATFVFLFLCILIVYIFYAFDPYPVPWKHAMSWGRLLTIIALTLSIPFLVWYTLKLWLQGDVSPFPDVDHAWKAGLEELAKNGLSIKDAPVFLVLGTGSDRHDENVMASSRLNLRINGVPQGSAALHWYANAEGIYLVLGETGCLSRLAQLGQQPRRRSPEAPESVPRGLSSPPETPGRPGGVPHRGTMVMQPGQQGFGDPGAPSGGPGSDLGGSTPAPGLPTGAGSQPDSKVLVAAGLAPPSASPEPASAAAMAPPAGSGKGTMMLAPAQLDELRSGTSRGTLVSSGQPEAFAAPAATSAGLLDGIRDAEQTGPEPDPVQLSGLEAAEQTRRLEYLCYLIREARKPLCPINGILTLLPMELLSRGNTTGSELQRALKSDLSAIRRMLQVRCPATALVVGLEQESGFRELVRRVGQDQAETRRFGRGADLWIRPSVSYVSAVCTHACEAFESWIYALFREQGALSKPGNTRLYLLLCQVRRTLQKRLASILVGAFSEPDDASEEGDSLLFGGCYFAAVGSREDRRAFAQAVFDKLTDQQEEVEWTAQALATERWKTRLSWSLLFLDVILGVGLAIWLGSIFASFWNE